MNGDLPPDAAAAVMDAPLPAPPDPDGPAQELSNPYVGPRPFGPEHADRFFGRDAEADDIVSLIISHPVLLLYAASGAGKTSLLNAQVIPLLRAQHCIVFGPARVAMVARAGRGADPNPLWTGAMSSLAPEEKQALQAALDAPADSEPPSAAGAPPQVLVFDQFEEVFTSAPEYWRERLQFFDALGGWLERNRRLRVVFAMREEYVARMERYASVLPERLRTRFRLERLREDSALLAVEQPLEKTPRRFAPGAAAKLVGHLMRMPARDGVEDERSDEFVEPVQLQLVCQKLWESLDADVTEIDDLSVEQHGDVDQALEAHYDRCIAAVAGPEVSEGRLRRWVRGLITAEGTRAIVFQEREFTAGLPNSIVQKLEEMYLLGAEVRGNDNWYELAHDRFVLPVTRSNQRWERQRAAEQVMGSQLEDLAKGWVVQRRLPALLLSSTEVATATKWLKSPDADEFGPSATVKEFVEASERAIATRRVRRAVVAVAGIAAVSILVVVLAYLALTGARQTGARAQRAKWNALGMVAQNLASQPGKEFDALMWGIQAVGEAVVEERTPPDDAVKALRQAVATIGSAHWLRAGGSATVGGALSPGGSTAAVVDEDTVRIWELGAGRVSDRFAADTGYTWIGIRFLNDRLILGTAQLKPGPNAGAGLAQFRYRIRPIGQTPSLDALNARLASGSSAAFADTLVLVYGRTRNAEVAGVFSYGDRRTTLPQASTGWSRAVLSPTGEYIVAFRDNTFEIWSVRRRMRVAQAPWTARQSGVVFAPDGRLAVIYEYFSEEPVQFWSLPAEPASIPPGQSGQAFAPRLADRVTPGVMAVRSAQFSRDGTAVFLAGIDNRVQVIKLNVEVSQPIDVPDAEELSLSRGWVTTLDLDSAGTRVTVSNPIDRAKRGQVSIRGEVHFAEPDSALRQVLVVRSNDAVVIPVAPGTHPERGEPALLVRTACRQIAREPQASQVHDICRQLAQ